jgi:hypothetical protein
MLWSTGNLFGAYPYSYGYSVYPYGGYYGGFRSFYGGYPYGGWYGW